MARLQIGPSFVDRSTALAAGATAQKICGDFEARQVLVIQNVSADTLWINFGDKATQAPPSLRLLTGEMFVMETPGFVDTSEVWIIGPNAGAVFTVKEA